MRIALVSTDLDFADEAVAYTAAMSRAWISAGHEVHLICGAPKGRLRIVEIPGLTSHTVSHNLTPEFDVHPFPFMRHAMGVFRLLCTLHDREPFDYIEFPDCGAAGVFAIRAKRTIGRLGSAVLGMRLHTPTHERRGFNEELMLDEEVASLEYCEESAIREADLLISPTRALLSMLTRRLDPHNASVVIPYPTEIVAEERVAEALKLGRVARPGSSRSTVYYFGWMDRRAGVATLIQAGQRLLARGVDCEFRLVGGGGPLVEQLRGMVVPRWKDRFVFEATYSRADQAAVVREAQGEGAVVCCFPSLWENFSTECAEAMAAGATVVASDAGGMGELIQDGVSGLLFRAGDAASLESVLGRALGDAALRAAVSAAARERVATLCDPASIVAQTIAAVESIGGARNEGGRAAARPGATPAVSIIIPFFNLSAYLPEALQSVQRQTVKDYEVIIVDDGSTEAAAAPLLARVQSGEFGPIRIIKQDNGGLSSARNAGLAAARAPWVLPLDADDVLEPRFLEHALAAAARDPGLGLITSAVLYFFESYPQVRGVWVPLGFARDLLCTTNCASSCTALIDRATLTDAGGYDANLGSYEDWDLYCRLALRGVRATVIPEPLIRYRLRADSMMRTVGISRRKELHAQLLARYPTLAQTPERAMRIILSRAETAEVRAREIIDENIRYRIADKVNVALKRTGVQRAVKGLASRVFGLRQESEP